MGSRIPEAIARVRKRGERAETMCNATLSIKAMLGVGCDGTESKVMERKALSRHLKSLYKV